MRDRATSGDRGTTKRRAARHRRRPPGYLLRLFVAGATPRSRNALLQVRDLCRRVLKDDVDLEVIDVYQQPILARDGQIIATPTLVRELPKPVRRLIGDLSNSQKLFVGLNLTHGPADRAAVSAVGRRSKRAVRDASPRPAANAPSRTRPPS